ncbi:MAG: GMC family oxidoreductase [Ilumatobacter sp.]|uniref:GMC family oxidoreductase n=1 Tax=Ilumatobacter sp. TaxID=1967498 RepID=UPI003298FD68
MKWVVVGAGSAGCVVTRRLVDAGHDVTLVESGPALRAGAVPASISGADSFLALAEPGRTHDGLTARRMATTRRVPYPRGRGEGGSSAVNSMVALRGDPALYSSWGWHDAADMFDRVLVPVETPHTDEVGRLARILLEADARTRLAPLTRRHGHRVTAAEAYLWPVQDRFEARPHDTVDVVEFDDTGCASGIRLADGTRIDADAVALCAGAIHTPAILLRSGITDPDVGRGLTDHPAAALTLRLRDRSGADGLSVSALLEIDPVQVLALDHLGPGAPPDIAVLLVALMRPVGAAGAVRLASDDPHVHPIVDLDMLEDERDVARLCDGVEEAIVLLRSAAFSAAIDGILIDDVGTPVDALDGRDAIESWVLRRGADYVHAACSTARALDDHGRVRGCERLVVADASAFPIIPDVNTHLPTMMLAERFVGHWLDADADAST